MKSGDDTHLYPDIDHQKCVRCRLCDAVCPIIAPDRWKNPVREMTAARVKDKADFMKSSSGGAFKCVVRAWMKTVPAGEDMYVCGCVFDDAHKAKHIIKRVHVPDDADCFSKSKYIQSDLENVYRDITGIVQNGGHVLFSGTPCQCSALKSSLDRKASGHDENVFYVDLICRGAPSQRQFDDHISELEQAAGSKVLKFSFREKEQLDNGSYYTRSAKIVYANGRVDRPSRLENSFLDGFYLKRLDKFSCTVCPFSDMRRVGDITIGDAWGIEKQIETIHSVRGISLILYVTARGLNLRKDIEDNMEVFQCDMKKLIQNNPALLPKGVL